MHNPSIQQNKPGKISVEVLAAKHNIYLPDATTLPPCYHGSLRMWLTRKLRTTKGIHSNRWAGLKADPARLEATRQQNARACQAYRARKRAATTITCA